MSAITPELIRKLKDARKCWICGRPNKVLFEYRYRDTPGAFGYTLFFKCLDKKCNGMDNYFDTSDVVEISHEEFNEILDIGIKSRFAKNGHQEFMTVTESFLKIGVEELCKKRERKKT